MKNIIKAIFLSIFIIPLSFAQVQPYYVLEANNKAGGKIVLKSTKCRFSFKDKKSEKLNAMYSGDKENKTVDHGCWFLSGDLVIVLWADGSTISYPFAEFKPIKKYDFKNEVEIDKMIDFI